MIRCIRYYFSSLVFLEIKEINPHLGFMNRTDGTNSRF